MKVALSFNPIKIKKVGIFLVLLIAFLSLTAQESIMRFEAVSPNEVDRYYQEQADLYIAIFEKKLKPAKQYMERLNKMSSLTQKEQSKKLGLEKLIKKYEDSHQAWNEVKLGLDSNRNEEFARIIEDSVCYELILVNGDKMRYHGLPEEIESDEMTWYIYKKPSIKRQKTTVKKSNTQWERRADPDCKEPDPDKCATWCLVRIPEEVKWIKLRGTESCPRDFEFTSDRRKCFKEVKLESKSTNRKSIIKAVDLGREILITSWEKVKC